jgi:hypothetical protein
MSGNRDTLNEAADHERASVVILLKYPNQSEKFRLINGKTNNAHHLDAFHLLHSSHSIGQKRLSAQKCRQRKDF